MTTNTSSGPNFQKLKGVYPIPAEPGVYQFSKIKRGIPNSSGTGGIPIFKN
jgi:hypothetical protein